MGLVEYAPKSQTLGPVIHRVPYSLGFSLSFETVGIENSSRVVALGFGVEIPEVAITATKIIEITIAAAIPAIIYPSKSFRLASAEPAECVQYQTASVTARIS